jgi:prolyl-tRNA editing enzyme YbaK/EbsC (Cys-tRNA(Pro) deacylase)
MFQPSARGPGSHPRVFNRRASAWPIAIGQALTGCVIGAIPPFSLNEQLLLLADPLVQENEQVVFNAGRLDRSIFMGSADYVRVARPQLVSISVSS